MAPDSTSARECRWFHARSRLLYVVLKRPQCRSFDTRVQTALWGPFSKWLTRELDAQILTLKTVVHTRHWCSHARRARGNCATVLRRHSLRSRRRDEGIVNPNPAGGASRRGGGRGRGNRAALGSPRKQSVDLKQSCLSGRAPCRHWEAPVRGRCRGGWRRRSLGRCGWRSRGVEGRVRAARGISAVNRVSAVRRVQS